MNEDDLVIMKIINCQNYLELQNEFNKFFVI